MYDYFSHFTRKVAFSADREHLIRAITRGGKYCAGRSGLTGAVAGVGNQWRLAVSE
jgi:hypothetical protein